MLVKKKVITETYETVEVNLPAYFKDSDTWFAIFEEKRAVKISFVAEWTWINTSLTANEVLQERGLEEITEQDFDFAYQMAIDRLTKAVQPQKEAV